MALESATHVTDLVATNPASTDEQKQGDDHLRLIKSVLKTTFPNASKPVYFPNALTVSASAVLLATADKRLFFVDATAGVVDLTLPTLGAGNAGWSIEVVKVDASANAARVVPAAGTISGAANVSLGLQYEYSEVVWSGTGWYSIPGGIVSTGDIVDLAVSTAKIANKAVTFGKFQDINTAVLLGRLTALAGVVEELTPAQITASFVNLFTAHAATPLKGAVPGALTADVTAEKVLGAGAAWVHSGAPHGVIVDSKAAGSDGGGSNTAWTQRTLNTIVRNVGTFISLASSRFTIPAGSYYIEASAPATHDGGDTRHKVRLFNVTDTDVVGYGTPAREDNGTVGRAELALTVTIAAPKAFQIEHRVSLSQGGDGFGVASNLGGEEIYTMVKIWRV